MDIERCNELLNKMNEDVNKVKEGIEEIKIMQITEKNNPDVWALLQPKE